MRAVKTPERTCWSTEHLLVRSKGYRVESAEGTLGRVEDVLLDPSYGAWGEPVALRVRMEAGVVTVPIEDVLELCPNEKRLVVRRPAGAR
jgi:hypothetical protein